MSGCYHTPAATREAPCNRLKRVLFSSDPQYSGPQGSPIDTFFDVMGMFASSMGEDCTFCHLKQSVFDHNAFGEETPRIRRAWEVIAMMNTINDANFGGRKMVTCFTCHRGNSTPVNSPKLALQYGEPVDDPNVMNFPAETNITADQILDRYLQTLGGAAQLA